MLPVSPPFVIQADQTLLDIQLVQAGPHEHSAASSMICQTETLIRSLSLYSQTPKCIVLLSMWNSTMLVCGYADDERPSVLPRLRALLFQVYCPSMNY